MARGRKGKGKGSAAPSPEPKRPPNYTVHNIPDGAVWLRANDGMRHKLGATCSMTIRQVLNPTPLSPRGICARHRAARRKCYISHAARINARTLNITVNAEQRPFEPLREMQDRLARKQWYTNKSCAHFVEDLANFPIMYTWIDKNTQPITALRNRTLRGKEMLSLPPDPEEPIGTVRQHNKERERERSSASEREEEEEEEERPSSDAPTFPSGTLSNPDTATRALKERNAPSDSDSSDMREAKRQRIRSNRKSVRKVAQIQQLSVERRRKRANKAADAAVKKSKARRMDEHLDAWDELQDEVRGSLFSMDIGMKELTGFLTEHGQLATRADVQGLSDVALTSHTKSLDALRRSTSPLQSQLHQLQAHQERLVRQQVEFQRVILKHHRQLARNTLEAVARTAYAEEAARARDEWVISAIQAVAQSNNVAIPAAPIVAAYTTTDARVQSINAGRQAANLNPLGLLARLNPDTARESFREEVTPPPETPRVDRRWYRALDIKGAPYSGESSETSPTGSQEGRREPDEQGRKDGEAAPEEEKLKERGEEEEEEGEGKQEPKDQGKDPRPSSPKDGGRRGGQGGGRRGRSSA